MGDANFRDIRRKSSCVSCLFVFVSKMNKVFLVVCFLFISFSFSNAANYGILYADLEEYVADVQKKLLPLLGNNLTLIDVTSRTPLLEELASFDALLVYSNYPFFNSVILGDVIAAFVDSGRGVVVSAFAFTTYSDFAYGLAGRFLGTAPNNTYFVIKPALHTYYPALYGVFVDPSHPVLTGVQKFEGGELSSRILGNLTEGSHVVALWSDNSPLAATRVIHGVSRRVDLNFFPASSDANPSFWLSSTDGALLLANSLSWVAGSGRIECSAHSQCDTCSKNGCQWCLDSNQCSSQDFTCTNRIALSSDCAVLA